MRIHDIFSRRRIQAILSILGFLLTLAALCYFSAQLWESYTKAGLSGGLSVDWRIIGCAAVVYASAYLPMTLAWILALRAVGAKPGIPICAAVFLTSQPGKYLPGNVAHLLGRGFLSTRAGVTKRQSIEAIALEISGVFAAAGLIAATAFVTSGIRLPSYDIFAALPGTPARLTAAGIVILLISAVVGARARRKDAGLLSLAGMLVCYAANFIALSAALHLLVFKMSGVSNLDVLPIVVAASTVSWLLGFVTPGSPAGLGVREVALLTFLSGIANQSDLIVAIASLRVISIVVDLVAFLVGILIYSRLGSTKVFSLFGE